MKKRVVIVDDRQIFLKLIRVYLSDIYACFCFSKPSKAIEWLETGNRADLIISDYDMPNMDGLEFLSYLKSNDKFKSIPFVTLSCNDCDMQKDKALERGADDYISKPITPKELKTHIEKYLK